MSHGSRSQSSSHHHRSPSSHGSHSRSSSHHRHSYQYPSSAERDSSYHRSSRPQLITRRSASVPPELPSRKHVRFGGEEVLSSRTHIPSSPVMARFLGRRRRSSVSSEPNIEFWERELKYFADAEEAKERRRDSSRARYDLGRAYDYKLDPCYDRRSSRGRSSDRYYDRDDVMSELSSVSRTSSRRHSRTRTPSPVPRRHRRMRSPPPSEAPRRHRERTPEVVISSWDLS